MCCLVSNIGECVVGLTCYPDSEDLGYIKKRANPLCFEDRLPESTQNICFNVILFQTFREVQVRHTINIYIHIYMSKWIKNGFHSRTILARRGCVQKYQQTSSLRPFQRGEIINYLFHFSFQQDDICFSSLLTVENDAQNSIVSHKNLLFWSAFMSPSFYGRWGLNHWDLSFCCGIWQARLWYQRFWALKSIQVFISFCFISLNDWKTTQRYWAASQTSFRQI